MKTIRRFKFFVQSSMFLNIFILVLLFYKSYDDIDRYRFMNRFFEEASIGQYSANWFENILFGYTSLFFVNSFFLYILAYIHLYQIVQNMKQKLNLSSPHLLNEQKLFHFWKHRMTYFELRKRTHKIYGLIALIFFSSTFGVTIAVVLTLTLFFVITPDLIMYFVFYIHFLRFQHL